MGDGTVGGAHGSEGKLGVKGGRSMRSGASGREPRASAAHPGRHTGTPAALVLVAIALGACGGAGAAATCTPSGNELHIAVEESTTHRFDTECLAAPAGEAFTIEFVNDDDSVHGNHNVVIREGGDELFVGDVISGGESVVYEVDPLEAGTYGFLCSNHPNMNGTFVVS